MPKTSPKTTAKADTKAAPKAAETKPAAAKTIPATAAAKPVAAKAAGKGDHVFLVDGSSYIFRAYHALPPLNRKSDGLQVNAVLGFCNMLWKLLREMPEDNRPTHLAIVFDKSEITFRNKIYPDYKAHRPPAPDDLIPQFALIREAVRAFDLPCLEQIGFEADDLIATYVRQACERGASATIVSSDKDLMQLVTDCVTMYDTMKDRRIGISEVIEKFGVPPNKVVEVQALAGDSTDNVPGVPGIGIKTAAQLITEYGDLDQLLFRAGEIKQPKRREALLENAEKARISRQLVLLDDKVELDVPLDDLAVHEPDARKLVAFLKAMEFTTLTRRVAEYAQIDPANVDADPGYASGASVFTTLPPSDVVPTPGTGTPAQARPNQPNKSAGKEDKAASPKGAPISLAAAREEALRKLPVDRGKYQIIKTPGELDAFIARIHDAGHVAIETRANSIDPMQADLCGIALALAPNEACYVPLAHKQSGGGAGLFDAGLAPDQVKHDDALQALRPVLESAGILKIGFDLKFTAVMLAQHGITLRNIDDALLISYVLDAGRGSHALEQLSERWFGHAMLKESELLGSGKGKITFDQVPIDKAAPLSAEGVDIALRVWRVLKPRLVSEHMSAVYETLERPLVSVLARMERRGISIDRQVLSRLSGDFAQTAARVEAEIQQIAGEPVNVGSPKQIGDILFGKMGLPGGTKTKTGAWSTTAQVLDELAEQGHDFPKKILEWRQVSKLKSTYTDALPTYVNPQTHRVHTTYALAATTTGRLSSNEPNLQNIPVRTEDGRKIRRAFIATPGHRLVSADYSQIELRLLAEIADIPVLKQAFRDGLDIHAMTASEMFGVPIKGMPSEIRRRAKAINFGIIYGISAFGLANQLGIAREEASAYIKKYFERFPGIRAYMDETRDFCRNHGYVTTLFGRKCHYPDIKASNASVRAFNERAAINARLQGTAADIIRRAMTRVEDALAEKKLSAQMLLQVHDELIFEVPDDEVETTLPVVQKVMQDAPFPAVLLSVPLHVDARAANNWDEAH
ncbi:MULTISPECIES: DNA polymerase I [Bradyrhizobium]|uniref:DNA polymerase I n=1 Tax=Bradyrhizobium TaxID=374 RepID=UPI00155E3C4C|nr:MULTISPECIES: DNA polymerase I [Bradyrhizobium]MDD1519874.1 DNA polymerase I [Bradyrhizobium sp. WBAH30]MDD1544118.1 DNA polymerase I [Bradyrhizobium sp. WBAH41]MDD1560139.1 DNA polymerase I [Bradyrhizobium sp. WBAH23]MDD1566656.1 DNA polymerase I [Bradyrhizobium sp. WBAH33]MDD1593671.1 DNA polymerase I [Bradyrhizobium sp. WBAH42]